MKMKVTELKEAMGDKFHNQQLKGKLKKELV